MGNQENLTPVSQGPIATPYDYHFLLQYVSKLGKDMFGRDFIIDDVDKPVITKLLAYFLKDSSRSGRTGSEKGHPADGTNGLWQNCDHEDHE